MKKCMILIGSDTLNIDGRLAREIGLFGVKRIAEKKLSADLKKSALEYVFGVETIAIELEANARDKFGKILSAEWRKENSWRFSSKQHMYTACGRIDITPWARSKMVPRDQWLPLDTLVDEYERVARLVIAGIALEVGDDPGFVERFIQGTGVSIDSLIKASKKKIKPKRYHAPLDVHIYHGLYDKRGDGQGNLALREKLGVALDDALEKEKLGKSEGSTGGDEHFEFGYLVSDVEKAKACMRTALEALDVEPKKITFEEL